MRTVWSWLDKLTHHLNFEDMESENSTDESSEVGVALNKEDVNSGWEQNAEVDKAKKNEDIIVRPWRKFDVKRVDGKVVLRKL